MYDAGPRSVKCPLICFPPASGTADVFFRQILALTAVGYRVISVSNFFWYLKKIMLLWARDSWGHREKICFFLGLTLSNMSNDTIFMLVHFIVY